MALIGGTMIERRFTIRLAAEAFVVIISILAAFAIDAWWDAQQEAVLERELLTTLRDSFEENRRQARLVVGEAETQQTFIGRFIDMSAEEASELPPDSVYLFLESLWRPNYVRPDPDGPQYGPDLNNTALLATLDAGRLSLLSDARLLVALANWQGGAEFLAERSAQAIGLENEVLAAIAEFPELQTSLSGLDQMSRMVHDPSKLGPRLLGSVAERVRRDNEIMGLVARKGFYSRIEVRAIQDLSNQSEYVLGLLRENLRE